MDIKDRFLRKIELIPFHTCWEWRGALSKKGYGLIRVGAKNVKAHRLSYTLTKGHIPDGYLVCHTCDNKSCVNPDHLFLGTDEDNAFDSLVKGRTKKGIAKIYEAEIVDHYFHKRLSQSEISELLGISRTAIGRVIRSINVSRQRNCKT